MGCASSKALGSEVSAEKGNYTGFSRGILMPTHHQECPEDFHIVALTSSTYGILKVDNPKASEEENKEGMQGLGHSVKEVLNKLNNLEGKAEAEPQSWLEVSTMLEDLKKSTPIAKSNKPLQPDAIDINDIMRDLDEDTGLVKPSRRSALKKQGNGNSLPIHTLEELDKCIGGKGHNPKEAINLKASLKPIGTPKPSVDSTAKISKDSASNGDDRKQSSLIGTRDGAITNDSELFDDDFLASYQSAFTTLSEDDWKVVEACQAIEVEPTKNGVVDGEKWVDKECARMDTKEDRSDTVSAKAESSMGSSKEAQATETSEERKLNTPPSQSTAVGSRLSPLESYEELCPPGGKHAVVLYTTSLRGIRKTYDDCNKVREIVQSYGILIDERDVSMHLEYRNELRELMQRLVTVPRLFIKGKYIGGAEEVTKLVEEGQLACLFEGSTKAHGSSGGACDGCAGARFVPCLECSGSCKAVDAKRQVIRCPDCNENGLIQCPICS